jgi:hypothetical protein
MDDLDYELLSRIEVDQGCDTTGSPEFDLTESQYVLARLLQLRAQGLVRFAAAPKDEHYLAGPCQLTPDGQAKLASYRAFVRYSGPPIHIRS